MTFKKYKFRKYDKKYPELFKREKAKLRKSLGKNVFIEHVGSTSVPGLGGKGVLDIMVAVAKKDVGKVKKKLEKAGYVFKKSGGERDRLFFKKEYKYRGKVRMVHIQLTSNNSYIHKRMIKFRDCLIKDKKQAKKYAELKKKAVKKAGGEGKVYRECKGVVFEG